MTESEQASPKEEMNQIKPLKYSLSFGKFQKNFLILSAVIPLLVFILQIANLVFAIVNPPPGPPGFSFTRFLEMFTPLSVMLIMSIFGLVNFIFLLSWKKKVTEYNKQKEQFSKMIETTTEESDETPFISFSELSYRNLKFMKRMRILSIITGLVSVFYIVWVFMGYLALLGVTGIPVHTPPIVFNILNSIAQAVLIVYIIIQWIFFYRWNKKLILIEILEKQIFDELEL